MRIAHDLLMNMRGINTFITDDLLQECGTSCRLVRMSSLNFSKAASYLLMFYTFLKFFLNILHYFFDLAKFSHRSWWTIRVPLDGGREGRVDVCLFYQPVH